MLSVKRQEELNEAVEKVKDFPPGIISIASSFLGRYREFDICLHHLIVPPGTHVEWGMGINVAYSFNCGIRAMIKEEQYQWVWFLGDDHTFEPDLLYKLLKHKLDFVVPVVLKRSIPFSTVISHKSDRYYQSVTLDEIKNWQGIVDITELNIGNAGLLMNKVALSKLTDPVYEVGKTNSEFGGSDLYLCEKARAAGIKMYLDTDLSMGHITHCFFWLFRNEDGILTPDIRMTEGQEQS